VPIPRDNYRLVPDGQPYVDPLKDVQAAALAIAYGLSTFEAEVGKRGGDYKRVWEKLKLEKDELGQANLVLQSPANVPFGAPDDIKEQQEMMGNSASEAKEGVKKPATAKNGEARSEDDMKRSEVMELVALATRQQAPQPIQVTNVTRVEMDPATATLMGDAIGKATPKQDAPIVNVAAAAAPIVNVAAPVINVAAADAPTVNVAAPNVTVAAPNVTVAAPNVEIENNVTVPSRKVIARPNNDGSTTLTPQDV
jgi:phage baseplate assembly protein gpV